MINDFATLLQEVLEAVVKTIGSGFSDWDRKSYISVVNLLKKRDEIAVKEAVDQLVKEGKQFAIPPLYLTSQKHPSLAVREYCWKSLAKLDSYDNIQKHIQGKDLKASVHALIEVYGNYQIDYN